MTSTEAHLDESRLEKVRRAGGKTLARCPACAESGADQKGNHLVIFPNGKFACAAMQGDAEHRRRIFALVGVKGDFVPDPLHASRANVRRIRELWVRKEQSKLIAAAKRYREDIVASYKWQHADVWESSPQRIDSPLVEFDPRYFLSSMFPSDGIVWTGEVFDSGEGADSHWRSCADWHSPPDSQRIGPMTTPALWVPGTTSRTAKNVLAAPFTVLDFDGFEEKAPRNQNALRAHIDASLALVRWLREGQDWSLAAILWTGSKSIHAWFHTPAADVLESLKSISTSLGIDTGLIGRPEHPCRLPGHRHPKTGRRSRILWLQLPSDP